MTDIALELARRAQPELIKEKVRAAALEKGDELKEKVRAAAIDKRDELKLRAKESVMDRKERVVEGAREHQGMMRTLGAIGGALLGGMLMKKLLARKDRYEGQTFHAGSGYGYYGQPQQQQPYVATGYVAETYAQPVSQPVYDTSVGYGTTTGAYDAGYAAGGYTATDVGLGYEGQSWSAEGDVSGGGRMDAIKEKGAQVGEKLQDVKAQAADKFHDVKAAVSEKISDVKHKASDLGHQASDVKGQYVNRESLHAARDWSNEKLIDHPLAFAVGAFGIGMLASALIPASDKERQLMEPAKLKAKEQIHDLQHKVEKKISGVAQAFSADESESEIEAKDEPRIITSAFDDNLNPSVH